MPAWDASEVAYATDTSLNGTTQRSKSCAASSVGGAPFEQRYGHVVRVRIEDSVGERGNPDRRQHHAGEGQELERTKRFGGGLLEGFDTPGDAIA